MARPRIATIAVSGLPEPVSVYSVTKLGDNLFLTLIDRMQSKAPSQVSLPHRNAMRGKAGPAQAPRDSGEYLIALSVAIAVSMEVAKRGSRIWGARE